MSSSLFDGTQSALPFPASDGGFLTCGQRLRVSPERGALGHKSAFCLLPALLVGILDPDSESDDAFFAIRSEFTVSHTPSAERGPQVPRRPTNLGPPGANNQSTTKRRVALSSATHQECHGGVGGGRERGGHGEHQRARHGVPRPEGGAEGRVRHQGSPVLEDI